MIDYRLKRSKRKTISIEVGADGVLVRAPYCTPLREIEGFLTAKASWIEKHRQKIQQEIADVPRLTPAELHELAERAKQVIPARCAYYAAQMGVHYGRITIRNQRTRWGSCSAKGNLNFNCLLMLTPPEVIDSVVVHELSHLRHMDHSKAFYAEVYAAYPEYDKYDRWLKEHGAAIMQRNLG